jgi:hypothetical protein
MRLPIHPVERIDKDRPDVIVVLPWNLETEITKQLAHVSEWGAQLVYPLPTLHFANGTSANDERTGAGK